MPHFGLYWGWEPLPVSGTAFLLYTLRAGRSFLPNEASYRKQLYPSPLRNKQRVTVVSFSAQLISSGESWSLCSNQMVLQIVAGLGSWLQQPLSAEALGFPSPFLLRQWLQGQSAGAQARSVPALSAREKGLSSSRSWLPGSFLKACPPCSHFCL